MSVSAVMVLTVAKNQFHTILYSVHTYQCAANTSFKNYAYSSFYTPVRNLARIRTIYCSRGKKILYNNIIKHDLDRAFCN